MVREFDFVGEVIEIATDLADAVGSVVALDEPRTLEVERESSVPVVLRDVTFRVDDELPSGHVRLPTGLLIDVREPPTEAP